MKQQRALVEILRFEIIDFKCFSVTFWPKMIQFFFMAVAYGSGQRILLLSDDVDDSGPGYG